MGNSNEYYSNRKETLKVRISFLIIFSLALVIFYSFYLYSIQVISGDKYRERARDVARRVSVIPTLRGEIFDRHYDIPLVTNVNSFAVDIIPAEIDFSRFDDIAAQLADILEINKNDILSRVTPRMRHQFAPVEIRNNIEYEKILVLAENIVRFPGVVWRSKPIRRHQGPGSLSHVVGYVGRITREELQILHNQGYTHNSILGKMGIEREYDLILRGRDGVRHSTVDARGRKVGDARRVIPPVIGQNLVLTIDRHIQELSEKALGERIGSVVVMRPSTGEILAMVSYPWFDPNRLYSNAGSQYFAALSADTRFPFLNRTIQAAYAPASAFKIFMTAAILEEEVFSPRQRIECRGRIFLGDRFFHCHRRTGHGFLDLSSAHAESCNIYYFIVGREHLGIDNIVKYTRRFGFGQRTGIDIPGEVSGFVPSPEWKLATLNVPWVGGDTFNFSIGQGFLDVTPLQMANAVSMVVNEGVSFVPRLLKEIRDPVTGKVIEPFEPRVLYQTNMRRETFQKTKSTMRDVVTRGTARVVVTTRATEVAGKTGTGEVGDDRSSWFAAFAPYRTDNPAEQVVVVVMVEARNEWEWWAPKAANVIFHGIFTNQTFEEVVACLNVWYLR
ncbi:MAG: penicillin-binding protein 2 [Spirochaetes bacterium]|nr:penicillin-binding protein 2 [Spirochaetota bacterium]